MGDPPLIGDEAYMISYVRLENLGFSENLSYRTLG